MVSIHSVETQAQTPAPLPTPAAGKIALHAGHAKIRLALEPASSPGNARTLAGHRWTEADRADPAQTGTTLASEPRGQLRVLSAGRPEVLARRTGGEGRKRT